jgi:AcrR family transcriptional regulator
MAKRPRKSSHQVGYGDSGQAILDAVTEVLAVRGPGAVMVGEICKERGISPSLVNYHFGSRERLLAEAVVREHEKLVAEMNHITSTTLSSPEEQLKARIMHRVAWTTQHPGIDSMVNYSHIIDPVGEVLQGELAERVAACTISDMAGLHTSVYGMYLDQALDRQPAELGYEDVFELVDITAFLALGCLGLATWMSGHHPASRALGLGHPDTMLFLADSYVTRLIRNVRTEVDQVRTARSAASGSH